MIGNLQVLLTEDPKQKALLTHHAWQKFQAGGMPVGQAQPPPQPARPARPQVQHLSSSTPPSGKIPLLLHLSSLTTYKMLQAISICSCQSFQSEHEYNMKASLTLYSEWLLRCSVVCMHQCCFNNLHKNQETEKFIIICQNTVLPVQLVPPKQVPIPKQSPLPLPVYM